MLFFASSPSREEIFGELLAAHPDARRLLLHCDGLDVDVTATLAMRAVTDDARAAGITVELVDVPPQSRRILSRVLRFEVAEVAPAPESADDDDRRACRG